MVLKLYSIEDSPPCLAVKMGLKYLKLKYKTIDVDFGKGEQYSQEYLKKNPSGEVPCLEDDGFFVNERYPKMKLSKQSDSFGPNPNFIYDILYFSAAILQYLADKYKKDDTFYPSDPQERANVNHRLIFNNTTLYRGILDFWVFTTFYAYPKMEINAKKMRHAVNVFNRMLGQSKAHYAAGTDKITIADLPLLMSMVCLDSIDFDMSAYPNVTKWYQYIQKHETDLWEIGSKTLDSYRSFIKNPPKESVIPKSHPIHPCKLSEFC